MIIKKAGDRGNVDKHTHTHITKAKTTTTTMPTTNNNSYNGDADDAYVYDVDNLVIFVENRNKIL